MLREARAPARASSESGSAVAEFVMVASLLTVLTLGVMQLALALHVRNTVLDAAAEGARYASLADSSLAEGAARTRDLIQTAVGPDYARGVTASYGSEAGFPSVQMRVVTRLPLLGLFGIDRGLEVEGHAARETAE
ncbi:TadE/TadG family type IV pilus assembly protein [Cryobacterium psychrophilum]|uniref:Pilus assembly protein n=1 Tax=Cryobacterium psychrophilum TaxID=41988 RepID=A0A4Y8KUV6_9MICO|nr:TadE family protein [Cryobacterium psychrophilum]TDW31040.1 TadE-like protein [Cryobacterium psychrophilum]TFD80915.1 pilus assembly protein [Cryobacterium psychrophilum]